jgi:hypothetical protein
MSVCPSCKAEGWSLGAPCPTCGAVAVAVPDLIPDLELAPRHPPKPRAATAKGKADEERIDLAVDLDALRDASGRASPIDVPLPNSPAPIERSPARVEADDALEARSLADYGDAPKNIFYAPLYAYRVLKRQADLKKALIGRREEANVALAAAEDAMVSLGERVRPRAASDPACSAILSALKQAEELVRSRDHSLAREQDAHNERLASMDARAVKLEQELLAAKAEERKTAAEHADAVATLQRAEAKLKRAEIELRALQAAQSGKRTRA